MKITEAIKIVKPHLTKTRFEHTLRVADTAVELAKLYNQPKEDVELAAVFHDYAKCRSTEELRRWIKGSSLPKDLLQYHHELWHGPVASFLIESDYGITNNRISSAIRYHTTGKAHMNNFDLIIFVADYIEPGRDFPGVEEVREVAKKDLVYAAWMVSHNTVQYLMKKRQTIYPDTFHAYNDLTRRLS